MPRSSSAGSTTRRAPQPPPIGPGDRDETDETWHLSADGFHIGRRHVHDPDGHPVVIDWRAPVSRPFYRASQGDPMGLARRRRFGFSGGQLTAFEDENFTAAGPRQRAGRDRSSPGQRRRASTPAQPLVIEEIERPRSGSMRDIVATIQPDQDDIVRAERGRVRLRPGRAGDRQDRRRPAPGRLPALRAPGADEPGRHAGAGAEPGFPRLHPQRPARARRVRRRADLGHRADLRGARPRRRLRAGGAGSRAMPGWPRCCAGRCGSGSASGPSRSC